MDEFSYLSEFPDNISTNSDDTDFLLSSNVDKLVLQRDGEVDSDDQDTVCLTTEENYKFTSFAKNNGCDQRSDITDATADLSFVQRLKSSYKPHVHEVSVVTTSHDPLMNLMNEEEKEEFEKMDEKVREGQNIINKLLADISRNRFDDM
ncbi:uncharacterized protein [Clytia hemisphaerica]|uniref:uncharacterized protein n=1 Tax=Clytia hemisphaerica TaxID=252671 RepID=UPI0034D40E37